MIRNFDQLLDVVRELPPQRLSVAAATDPQTLASVCEARRQGFVEGAYLYGDEKAIRETAEREQFDLNGFDIVDVFNPADAAIAAVKEVSAGNAGIFVKGYVHSSDFLRAVLNKEYGLRDKHQLSHVFVLEATHLERLLFVTDGAMNLAPDLKTKAALIANAVDLAHKFDIETPKVAVLSAIAAIKPSIPSTIDAAVLSKMTERRQLKHCVIDGPLALDNAINAEAAAYKKIGGDVAGQADILLVPNVETGNILSKSMPHMYGGHMGGVVLGGRAPVVLPSRSDSLHDKMLGIAIASLVAAKGVNIQQVHW